MAARAPSTPDPLTLVRALWDAMRDRDVDAAMGLMHEEVEWVQLLGDGEPVRGAEALRAHLEALAGSGVVADAYPLAYDELPDGRVLVSGALRVRRPDNWMATVQRWWIYVLEDGRIRRAQACITQEDALATPLVG